MVRAPPFSIRAGVEALSVLIPLSGCWSTYKTRGVNALIRWARRPENRYLPHSHRARLAHTRCQKPRRARCLALRRVPLRMAAVPMTGRKLWITNANEADIFIVFATVNPAGGYKGITAFVIERGFPGFSIGKKEDKLGIRASSTCELLLEDCRVPRVNVLGDVGRGYKVAIETLNEGRIGIGAQMVGLAQGALDHALAYTKERKQFGRASLIFRACSSNSHVPQRSSKPRGCSSITPRAFAIAVSLPDCGRHVQAVCGRRREHITSLSVQLFGGYGYVKDTLSKSCIATRKSERLRGTSNLQLQTIAKRYWA